MAFIDYYKILGVKKDIPQKDVRAAYRKRAKQFHPDLHPNDAKAKAKFQALSEAYEVISDPESALNMISMVSNGVMLKLSKILVVAGKIAIVITRHLMVLTLTEWVADLVVSSKIYLVVVQEVVLVGEQVKTIHLLHQMKW